VELHVATRYHSLVVLEQSLPAELEVSARAADDGAVMGLRTFAQVAQEVREDLTAAQQRAPAARSVSRIEILLTYGGVQALAGANLTVRAGSVHTRGRSQRERKRGKTKNQESMKKGKKK